jgi:molybdopterin adenylyltransferase
MSSSLPHPDGLGPDGRGQTISCGIITVSDTRTTDTDTSGQCIQSLLTQAGHRVVAYHVVQDNPQTIQALVQALVAETAQSGVQSGAQSSLASGLEAIIINGGTGIAPRDTTYDAIAALLDKELPGFGEIFRSLSFAEIGSRAIASRATAGVYQNVLIFSVPGSTKAVQLAMERLILPELRHLVKLLQE